MAAAPLATRVQMRNLEAVDDVCRSALGCGGVDLATVALLAVTGVLALVVFAVAVHVREATSAVDEERERLAVERDAFARFARRVDDIEVPEAGAAMSAAGGIVTASASQADGRLDRVREAYRETVMAVPHYESDYGERLGDNVAAEFGEDVALAVVDGERLTPQLQSALVRGSREAQHSRSNLLSTLEAEAESLDGAGSAIEEVQAEQEAVAERTASGDRTFETLEDDWRRLDDLADRCREVVAERQETIRERSPTTPPSVPDLQEYLYDDLPVRHPVLADAAAAIESIERLRSRVLDSLTRQA